MNQIPNLQRNYIINDRQTKSIDCGIKANEICMHYARKDFYLTGNMRSRQEISIKHLQFDPFFFLFASSLARVLLKKGATKKGID